MTQNYVILLRCDDVRPGSSHCADLLIHMVPVDQLRLENRGRRTLQMALPSGGICYFKLPVGPGCGEAWTRWRTLAYARRGDPFPGRLVPESRLVPFSDLDGEIREQLAEQNFAARFFNPEKLWTSVVPSTIDPQTEESSSSTDEDTYRSDSQQQQQVVEVIGPRRRARKQRKSVRRFGEGIPENCVFELSLSYSDETQQAAAPTPLAEEGAKHAPRESPPTPEVAYRKKGHGRATTESDGAGQSIAAAHFFTHVSLLVVPGGLRRSPSLDSVSQISPDGHHRDYLTTCSSLPDLHDLIMHRRYNRLSYLVNDFCPDDETDHSAHEISFRLPNGRMYCSHPICRKRAAHATRLQADRWHHRLSLYDEWRAARLRYLYACPVAPHREPLEEFSSITRRVSKSFEILCEKRSLLDRSLNEMLITSSSSSSSGGMRHTLGNRYPDPGLPPDAPDLSHALHRLQQRMFCEVETPEILRFLLRPDTVNEVNCPYLCGYLFFFERLKGLVTAEIARRRGLEEALRCHRHFVQVALSCFERKDCQSAYAVTAGLCSPAIPHYGELWSRIRTDSTGHRKHTNQLFRHCWNRKKWHGTRQHIPFFLDFVAFIVATLMKEMRNSQKESIWGACPISKNYSRRNLNMRNKKIFAELRILCNRNLETVIDIIEECRKYYIYNEVLNSNTTDIHIKEYLLVQPYH